MDNKVAVRELLENLLRVLQEEERALKQPDPERLSLAERRIESLVEKLGRLTDLSGMDPSEREPLVRLVREIRQKREANRQLLQAQVDRARDELMAFRQSRCAHRSYRQSDFPPEALYLNRGC